MWDILGEYMEKKQQRKSHIKQNQYEEKIQPKQEIWWTDEKETSIKYRDKRIEGPCYKDPFSMGLFSLLKRLFTI